MSNDISENEQTARFNSRPRFTEQLVAAKPAFDPERTCGQVETTIKNGQDVSNDTQERRDLPPVDPSLEINSKEESMSNPNPDNQNQQQGGQQDQGGQNKPGQGGQQQGGQNKPGQGGQQQGGQNKPGQQGGQQR